MAWYYFYKVIKRQNFLLIALTTLFVCVVGISFFYISYRAFQNRTALVPSGRPGVVDATGKAIAVVPSEKIYLSLRLKVATTSKVASTTGLYVFDVHTNRLTQLLSDRDSHITYSTFGTKAVFSSQIEYGKNRNFQISFFDTSKKLPLVFITFSTTTRDKRFPVLSPQGTTVAFAAHTGKKIMEVEDWGIYLSALPETYVASSGPREKKVDSGYNPMFIHGGNELLYLKNDGIYAKSVMGSGKAIKRISAQSTHTDINASFSLSKDEKILVWSDPTQHLLQTYAVGQNDPPTLTKLSQQHTILFEPHLEGDANQFVVGIAASHENKDAFALVRLDLAHLKKYELFTFTSFDPKYVFLSQVQ